MCSKTPLRRFYCNRKADWILVGESEFSFVNPKPELNVGWPELRVDKEVGRGPEEAVARLEPKLLGGPVTHPAIHFAASHLKLNVLVRLGWFR
jgi:hypothetical protein